jgi:hypothetical protein
MADIPLKSEEETTTDLVGAIEDIAQSVKAGSRDFTKSFNGLTTAIKKMQTSFVNAIKAIKVQVVTKPEKAAKQPPRAKETSTKEVTKEKETRTEVKPEKKTKTTKIEAAKINVPEIIVPKIETPEVKPSKSKAAKDPAAPKKTKAEEPKPTAPKKAKAEKEPPVPKLPKVLKPVDPEVEAEKQRKKKRLEESAELRLQTQKNALQLSALRLQNALNPPPKAPPKEKQKPVDPQEKERIAQEKKRAKEIESRQEKVKPVKISSLIEGINNTGDAWSKMISGIRKSIVDSENARKAAEKKVEKSGKEGTKDFVGPLKKDFEENERKKSLPSGPEFVGPPQDLFIRDQKKQKDEEDVKKSGKEGSKVFVGPPKKLFEKNEESSSNAAAQAIIDASKRRDDAEKEAANAEKVLRTYFRKQEEKQVSEDEKAAKELIKQQEQAARELAQANQKTKRELDSLIAGFQGLSSLFKGPLVRFGLNMVAKGIGFKQPKTMSKGGDVSYLADGGAAMKPKGTDTQPAMLTPGEFVVNKKAAQDPENRKQLELINSNKSKKRLGESLSGSFLKSNIHQYKQNTTNTNVEYHSSGGSVGGIGYYAAGGPVVTAAGAAFVAVGAAINSVTKSFAIASEAVSSFASAVQKANPALMEQVGLAMDDLQGVVGRALTPAITMIIPLIRQFADYVDYASKKFAPATEAFVKVIRELLKPVLELGVTITNALMPSIKLSVLLFAGMVKILIPIIDLFSSLFETLSMLLEPLGNSEFLFGVFNNSIEILSRAVSIVAGTIQLVIGAFVVGVSKMIEVLGAMVDYIPFSGDAGKSIEGFGEKVGKVGEKLYNKSLENFRAVGEGKPRRFRAGEMSGDKGLEKDSSYGAAVRQVQSFSIAGIGDEMRRNALMAGIGQKSQEESLNQIESNTGQLVTLFKDLKLPQSTGAGAIVGPNPYAPSTVNTNMGAIPGTTGTRYGTITPIN